MATDPQIRNLDPTVHQAALELHTRRSAKKSLIKYCQYTLPRYMVTWHNQALADLLEQVCWGNILRLMIFEPPRHGKSEHASIRFPAFYLGQHPQYSVIGTSYDLDLARGFSRGVRNTMLGRQHQALFPSKFASTNDTHWMLEGKEDERNNYIAAGVGGGITGQGANLLIIDDPIKNYEDALSQVKRDTVWNWWSTTARTRLAPRGAVLVILTRWHEDDLAGRLLRLAQEDPNADQWVVLELPWQNDQRDDVAKLWSTDGSLEEKVFDQYEALWPEQYSREELLKTKASMGTMQFGALYGCKPKIASGNIIKREWFRRWYVLPGDRLPTDATGMRPGYAFETCQALPGLGQLDFMCQSWDLAFKSLETSDYVSGGVWGIQGARKFLLDRDCTKKNFPETKQAILRMSAKWPLAFAKYVEDKANGPAVVADLNSTLPGLIAVPPVGSKEARLFAASPDAEAGDVVLPHPSIAPWVYDFIECLCSFPNGLNDDDCDMYSQAMYKLKTSGSGLLDFYKQQAGELKKHEAPLRSIWTGEMVKKTAIVQVEACPDCGNVHLARTREGVWSCVCGARGVAA